MTTRSDFTLPADLQASPEQHRALLEAILAVSADLSLAETLKHIVTAAAQLANARYAALGVPDETGTTLAEFVTHGLTEAESARISHQPHGHGLLGLLLRDEHSLRLRDLTKHPRAVGFPPNHPPMRSFLGVPIRHKGRILGSLYLTDKLGADEFSALDQALIELLARHAGLAIENARLYAQEQQLRVIEERQRIGMDLHDGVIQSIYAVGLTLEYVDSVLADGDVAAGRERLRLAVEGLNNTIRDIRAYILDLRPRRFEGDELIAGLQQLLAEFKANTLIRVDFIAEPGAEEALGPEGRLALFHIAQEALSNAAKHSRAAHMAVSLRQENGQVSLTLRDDGRGFDPQIVERRVGHGLNNMQDRAQAAGGQISIDSPAGRGTEVKVLVPPAR
ncbi:MAG: GAF domain-containing sensor histidine kinase [Anaerolineales bacterium]|nr:GAF domain-containing sensor histidine kinase [Anaerolineales bacterium]